MSTPRKPVITGTVKTSSGRMLVTTGFLDGGTIRMRGCQVDWENLGPKGRRALAGILDAAIQHLAEAPEIPASTFSLAPHAPQELRRTVSGRKQKGKKISHAKEAHVKHQVEDHPLGPAEINPLRFPLDLEPIEGISSGIFPPSSKRKAVAKK